MTAKDVLAQVREARPTGLSDDTILRFIERLDGKVKEELLNGYVYKPAKAGELLARPPYDEIYLYYAIAQIDLTEAEYEQYNNDMVMFQNLYGEYGRMISRTHKRLTDNHYNL